ncbi:unnamed protein product [Cylindrotheca closterium]|uniref:Uncharacterized protein n=1 Tax=Cylindrotheca closterium TaxID=2856 RepID=A0AAD2CF78_9STRA|nr:unnamed protein product [Cylindrotheca closterium]
MPSYNKGSSQTSSDKKKKPSRDEHGRHKDRKDKSSPSSTRRKSASRGSSNRYRHSPSSGRHRSSSTGRSNSPLPTAPHRSSRRSGSTTRNPPPAADSKHSNEKLRLADGSSVGLPSPATAPGAMESSSSHSHGRESRKSERESIRPQEVSSKTAPGALKSSSSHSNDRESRRAATEIIKQQEASSKAAPGTLTVSSSHSNDRQSRKAERENMRQQESSQMNVSSSHSMEDESTVLTAPGAQDVSSTGTVTRLASSIGKNQEHTNRSRNPSRNNSIDTEEPELGLPTSLFASHQMGTSDQDTVPSLFGSHRTAHSNDTVPTLEATAAPDMDEEIERARRHAREEGRKEGRNERQRENVEIPVGDLPIVVATASEEKKLSRKCTLAIAFVVLVVAMGGGVAAWQSGKSSARGQIVRQYAPPTEEDCLAVSQGLGVEGQNNTASNQVGLEMNFVFGSDVNLELLQGELEAKIQRKVLPLLVGCDIDGGVSIRSNFFIIDNAMLDMLTIGDPATCNSKSDQLCSHVYMEVDVISKDSKELDESVLEQFKDVFQDEATLELLNLASPVETIKSTKVFLVQASSSPSSSPSKQESETCTAIVNGIPVPGQDALTVQEYNILMDIVLDSETEAMAPLTMELKETIQRFLMPSLAGCTNQRRRLQIETFIANALVDAEVNIGAACLPDSESPCHRYVIHLDIYVERIVSTADFSGEIIANFRESPLVERLGLLSPFKNIIVVEYVPGPNEFTSTTAPPTSVPPTLSPSVNPTWAPVTYPTTNNPTRSPTTTPSLNPTRTPVAFPTTDDPTWSPTPIRTRGPTSRPTPMPTLLPSVVGPTSEPTPFPTPDPTPDPTPSPTPSQTPVPTLSPTDNPSKSPSAGPTPKPSLSPTPEPTRSPTAKPSVRPTRQPSTPLPTPQPSTSPTARPSATPKPCFATSTELSDAIDNYFDTELKASMEAQYGLIRNWCFGTGVASMEALFKGRERFNENLSLWDVSSVTTMRFMFDGATSFNQDISAWDVSSVTDMEGMFLEASLFNQDLSQWDVSSVTNLQSMFHEASSFNRDISSWDVSSVVQLDKMFQEATSFNQDISSWDVSSVTDMSDMFKAALSFNQDLCVWGSRIPIDEASVGSMFDDAISCPSQETSKPDLSLSPPGPFCYTC